MVNFKIKAHLKSDDTDLGSMDRYSSIEEPDLDFLDGSMCSTRFVNVGGDDGEK